MPDAPDGFKYSNVAEFTANLDSSELAARLYSPSIYARSGQILYQNDFLHGFGGLSNESSEGLGSINLATEFAMSSGLALKLNNTTDQSSDCYVGIEIPYAKARYYILDLGYVLGGSNIKARIELYVLIDGNRHYLELWHSYSPFKLEVRDENNDLIDITDLKIGNAYNGNSAHLRAAIDTATGNIQSILLNGETFNVDGLKYNYVSGSYEQEIQTYFGIEKASGASVTAYLQWIVVSLSDEL